MTVDESIYDVCIIGTGPAGAFVAHQLAKKNINVVMIEAGDANIDTNSSNVLDEDNGNITGTIDFGFSQQIGGTSNLWAGGLARFYPIDLVEREEFGFEGWPLDINELDDLYKRVNKLIGIPVSCQEKIDNELESLTSDTYLEAREMVMLNAPFCTSQLFIEVPGITLLKRLMAYKLNIENNTSISSVEVYDRDTKKSYDIKAKRFVIAAGALTNIRLLLHSLEESDEVLKELYDNVGKYFSTHPKANVGTIQLTESLDSRHPFLKYKRYDEYATRFQFGLNEQLLVQNGLLNHCVRFDSTLNYRFNRLFDVIKSMLGRVPGLNSGNGYFTERVANIGVSVYRFIDRISLVGRKGNLLTVRAFIDQSGSANNRVTLSDKVCESGLPLASIQWVFSEKDWVNVDEFMNMFSEQLTKAGIGEFQYRRPSTGEFTGIHSHFLGGTRCGTKRSTSVVDHDLKVHGLNNLYVSGPSVFPSFGYSNPFYTIAALSLRLADHISSSMDKVGKE